METAVKPQEMRKRRVILRFLFQPGYLEDEHTSCICMDLSGLPMTHSFLKGLARDLLLVNRPCVRYVVPQV